MCADLLTLYSSSEIIEICYPIFDQDRSNIILNSINGPGRFLKNVKLTDCFVIVPFNLKSGKALKIGDKVAFPSNKSKQGFTLSPINGINSDGSVSRIVSNEIETLSIELLDEYNPNVKFYIEKVSPVLYTTLVYETGNEGLEEINGTSFKRGIRVYMLAYSYRNMIFKRTYFILYTSKIKGDEEIYPWYLKVNHATGWKAVSLTPPVLNLNNVATN